MSAISPDQQAIVKELYSRRETLDPQRRAIVEELGNRIGLSAPVAPPVQSDDRSAGQVAQDQTLAAAKGVISPITSAVAHPLDTLGGLTPIGMAKGLWSGIKSIGEDVVPNIVHNAEALRQAYGGPAPTFGATPTQAENEKAAGVAGATAGGLTLAEGIAKFAPKLATAKARLAPLIESPGLDAPAVNKWMDVPAKEVMHGADPGQQLLDEKLLGPTKEATKANVQTALTDAGQKLQTKLQGATAQGIQIDAQTPVYDAVAGATKKIGSPRDAAFQAQMNGIVDDIEAKYPNLAKLTPEETHALKVDLGNSIKWSGQSYDTPANQAMIQIYRDLNTAIKSNVPGIAPIQSRWGNLFVASKNLAESMADDVVGKGSGPAVPALPPSPAAKFAKGAAKYVVPPLLGATAYKIFRDATGP